MTIFKAADPATRAPAIDPDALPCGWLRADVAGRLVTVNAPLRRLLGRETQVFDGARVDELLTGGARVLYHSYLLPLLRLHGRFDEFALALRHAGGSPVDVLVYATLHREGGRELIDAVMVPMRERRRLEDELLRVKRAADMAPGVIFQLAQGAGGVLAMPFASDALRRLYALAPDEVRDDATPLFDRIDPEDRPRVDAALRGAASSGSEWSDRFRVALPGRVTVWHEARAMARLAPDGGTVWHGFIADVSSRRALEDAVGQKEAAENASRAKSEFLARVSHELRTPLNGILGFAHLLRFEDTSSLKPEQRRRIEIIESSGRSLLRLIDEVLDLSRIEQGRVEVQLAPTLLRPLLEQALRMVEAQAMAREVELAPLVCSPRLAVMADANRLSQVLANLLSNAIKYNRRRGRVVLAAAEDGAGVRVAIEDTGPGLDDAQRRQLFQPFNRLGAERTGVEGTGLGLVITRQLVELMQGRLDVSSAPGRGSVFSFWLERADAPPPMPSPPLSRAAVGRATESAPPGARRRLLYAEDNPVNALLMEAMLELRPRIDLQVVSDGEALEQAALASPPDLLLLDLHLPGGDGIDLLTRLRRHAALAQVPAVMVSAAALPQDLARARAAGCVDYWTKPLDVDRTLARLDALLGAGPPAST